MNDTGELKKEPQKLNERWKPDICPITGRIFFMWIEHFETGQLVPTYGEPYDSYTIPVAAEDGSFSCDRYDHDYGGWVTDSQFCVGLKVVDDQAFVLEIDDEHYDKVYQYHEDLVKEAEKTDTD